MVGVDYMSKLPWKPWHEVVKLREDLQSGELSLQMFAADLCELLMQRGKQPVYEKPESFFSLTFPTHNLRNLVCATWRCAWRTRTTKQCASSNLSTAAARRTRSLRSITCVAPPAARRRGN